jgi:hypothetical protein
MLTGVRLAWAFYWSERPLTHVVCKSRKQKYAKELAIIPKGRKNQQVNEMHATIPLLEKDKKKKSSVDKRGIEPRTTPNRCIRCKADAKGVLYH